MSRWIAVLNMSTGTFRASWSLDDPFLPGAYGVVDGQSEIARRGIAIGRLAVVPLDTFDPDALAALTRAERANGLGGPAIVRKPTIEERVVQIEQTRPSFQIGGTEPALGSGLIWLRPV